jgi:hypothetical protein
MAKRRFSSCSASDEITMHGYRALTFAKCTTIMIAEFAVTRGLGSFSISWFGWEWDGFGLFFVEAL